MFNVGEYRRAVTEHAYKDFFDPDNAEAVAILKYATFSIEYQKANVRI